MDENALRRSVKRRCRPTIADYARRIGVHDEVLRAFVNGNRAPGPTLLRALGVERVVVYRRVRG